MKKFLIIGGMLAFTIMSNVNPAIASDKKKMTTKKVEWMAAKDGAWAGKDMVWYKLDKDAKVWWSKDGKKWEAVKDGMWQDKEGRWLKIGDGKLWWSADGGKNWAEVPEWQWEGSDGKWYKFDTKWSLWVNK